MDWYKKISADVDAIAENMDPVFNHWYVICTFDLADGRNNEASKLLSDEIPLEKAQPPWPENIYIGKVSIEKQEATNRIQASEWVADRIKDLFSAARRADGTLEPIRLSGNLFVAASELPFAIAYPVGLP